MARVLLFAAMRDAAGVFSVQIDGETVDDVLRTACKQFGAEFERLLPYCAVMVGQERVSGTESVDEADELAILPPVSGG